MLKYEVQCLINFLIHYSLFIIRNSEQVCLSEWRRQSERRISDRCLFHQLTAEILRHHGSSVWQFLAMPVTGHQFWILSFACRPSWCIAAGWRLECWINSKLNIFYPPKAIAQVGLPAKALAQAGSLATGHLTFHLIHDKVLQAIKNTNNNLP